MDGFCILLELLKEGSRRLVFSSRPFALFGQFSFLLVPCLGLQILKGLVLTVLGLTVLGITVLGLTVLGLTLLGLTVQGLTVLGHLCTALTKFALRKV